MSIRRILMMTAAVAMLTPLMAPTASFAEGRGSFAGNVAGGLAASRGMTSGSAPVAAAPSIGGGGWNRGTGGNWNRGGNVAMGGGGGWNHGGGGWNNGGGGWHHGGHGWRHGGFGAGLAAGALVGGALASSAYGPYYNGYDYGYYDQPDYYDDSAVVTAPVGDDAVGYCSRRFRSYDPGSGTYLGYDGVRHPCP